ncbi:MAG: FecR family protein [Pseudomonadota bacterium]
MSNEISRDIPNTSVIRTEASRWLAQLETGDLDHADVEVLREWMGRSPKHTAELRKLAKLSRDLNLLAQMSDSLNDAADFYHPITRKRPDFSWRGVMLVGCLIIAVLSIGWLSRPVGVESQVFATKAGEYDEHRLSDGSVIALNTSSRVSVAYSEHLREIHLQAGEAFFTVTRNANRPFVVKAGTQQVEAVGTAFLVRLDASQIEVSVTEGKVRLTTVSENTAVKASRPESILLETGQSLKVQSTATAADVNPVTKTELQRKLAWREGLLDFHKTALSEVVREVGRHTGIEIVFRDAELGSREFDGLFRVGETESLFEALKVRYGVEVTYLDTKRVLLSSKKESEKK